MCKRFCKIVVENNEEGKEVKKKKVNEKANHLEQKITKQRNMKELWKRALGKERAVTKCFIINMDVRFYLCIGRVSSKYQH